MSADKSVIRIVSDLHSRPDQMVGSAALAWLKAVPLRPDTKAIVLNGDVWDNWAEGWDDTPLSIGQTIQCDDVFALALIDAAKHTEVWITTGNHDQGLTQAGLDDALFALEGCPARLPDDPDRRPRLVPAYRTGLLLVEHGHRDALLNAPDPASDPVDRLPLGYWLCRLLSGRAPILSLRLLSEVIEESAQMLTGRDTLAEAVLDAACDLAGVARDQSIVLEDGRAEQLPVIRERYAGVFARWQHRQGLLCAAEAVVVDLPVPDGLVPAMRRRSRSGGFRVIATGHTHQPMLSRSGGAILANSGCFGPGGRQDWVEVEKLGGGAYEVRLYAGDGSKPAAVERAG